MTPSSSTDSNVSNPSGNPSAAIRAVNYSISLHCSDDEFKLFCWILGGRKPFSVKVGKGDTVDELKKRIKKAKEPELDYLAPDALNVWKVSKS